MSKTTGEIVTAGLSLAPVAIPALILKSWYSGTDAWGLQWILQPLAALTGIITGLVFEPGETGEWVNHATGIAIVKSCAGINFMALSLLIFTYRFTLNLKNSSGITRCVVVYSGMLILALLAAWYTTLLVNTLRIGLAVHLYVENVTLPGLDSRDLHLLTGVMVYFPALWLQCRVCCDHRIQVAGFIALSCYLVMVLLIPVLTGNYLEYPTRFFRHTLITLLTVSTIVAFVLLPGMLSRHEDQDP